MHNLKLAVPDDTYEVVDRCCAMFDLVDRRPSKTPSSVISDKHGYALVVTLQHFLSSVPHLKITKITWKLARHVRLMVAILNTFNTGHTCTEHHNSCPLYIHPTRALFPSEQPLSRDLNSNRDSSGASDCVLCGIFEGILVKNHRDTQRGWEWTHTYPSGGAHVYMQGRICM